MFRPAAGARGENPKSGERAARVLLPATRALLHCSPDIARPRPSVTRTREKRTTAVGGKTRTTEPTVRQQFRIPQSLVEKARAIARRDNVSTSEVVRRALTEFEKRKPKGELEQEIREIRRMLKELLEGARGR